MLRPLATFVLVAAIACGGDGESGSADAIPGPTPRINHGGIAAAPTEWQGLYPGGIATLYGYDIGLAAPCEPPANTSHYPTELCETQVLVDGMNAGLLYVGPNQINFQIPKEVRPQDAAPVRVIHQGRESAPQRVAIAAKVVLPDGDSEALGRKVARLVHDIPWGQTIENWREARPEAKCQRFRGTSGWLSAPEQWCYRCETTEEVLTAEWSFYAWYAEDSPACRLYQLHVRVRGFSEESLGEVHPVAAERLGRTWDEISEPAGDLSARGSAFWYDRRYWDWGAGEALLYRGNPPYVALLARAKPLIEAEAERRRVWSILANSDRKPGAEMDRHLAARLENDYPRLPLLLTQPPREGDLSEKRRQVFEMILRLLDDTASTGLDRQAAKLLAADRLADRLATLSEEEQKPGRPWPGFEAQREQLAARGVDYEWAHFGAVFANTHNLLRRVSEEFPDTVWGEQAFVILMGFGWDTSLRCSDSGKAYFEEVITRGEAFLADRLRSSHRREITWNLAQACETWWSLSQASLQDSYVRPENFEPGADEARTKAIRYYGELLSDGTDDLYALDAKLRLPRLQLAYDTNQRRFFQICD